MQLLLEVFGPYLAIVVYSQVKYGGIFSSVNFKLKIVSFVLIIIYYILAQQQFLNMFCTGCLRHGEPGTGYFIASLGAGILFDTELAKGRFFSLPDSFTAIGGILLIFFNPLMIRQSTYLF